MLPISVVIYVKNAVATIAEAIESTLAQDYPAFELIVVDGASTDGTVDVIRRYSARLKQFVSKPDRGPAQAANTGLALSAGEIVLFLMADDWLEPGALRDIAAAFAADPECDLVSSGVRVVEAKPDGGFAVVNGRSGSDNALTLDNILDVPFSAARYYRRRALVKTGGLSADFPHAHDRELLLRLFAEGAKARTIEQPLYVYRRHGNSNTLFFKPRIYRQIYDEHLRMAELYGRDLRFDEGTRDVIADWAVEQRARRVLLELRDGAWGAAVRTGWAAGLYRPAAMAALWRRWRAIKARRRANLF
jgi:glycosyltransferase involved in cell wall biosynthesis